MANTSPTTVEVKLTQAQINAALDALERLPVNERTTGDALDVRAKLEVAYDLLDQSPIG